MPGPAPKNSVIVWNIQKRLQQKGHKIKLDGDLGPATFWDRSETLNAILKELGGPVVEPEIKSEPTRTGHRVYIDIGHGRKPDGFDPGAVHAPNGPTEHALNIIGAQALAARLRERGLTVTINDENRHNFQAGMAAKGHDVMVSFHHNAAAGSAQYALTIYDDRKASKETIALASLISARVAKTLGIKDRGARGMALSVLQGARSVGVPSPILVEPYFIHAQTPAKPSVGEMPDWSARSGQAIGDAIADHLLGV